MTKVLFLIKAPAAGGAETYLLRFMKHFRDGDYTVFCKGASGGELESAYKEVCFLKKDMRLGYYNPFGFWRFYKYLKSENFSAVCDMQGNFSGFALICAKLAKIPTRIAFYRESKNKHNDSILKTAYTFVVTKAMLFSATRILANSKDALNHFHPGWETNPEKYKVIYNGFDVKYRSQKKRIDVRKQLGLSDNSFVIGHSGRYSSAKNHKMILKVAMTMCNLYPDVVFLLMGRDVEEHLLQEVRQNDMLDKIKILGHRDDVLDILKCLDLFYFPSITEGQPNALIEAMVSDVPFVASNIPPIMETTPKACHGMLVDPYNYEENLDRVKMAYEDIHKYDITKCSEWAIQTFDADRLFNEFRKELNEHTDSN